MRWSVKRRQQNSIYEIWASSWSEYCRGQISADCHDDFVHIYDDDNDNSDNDNDNRLERALRLHNAMQCHAMTLTSTTKHLRYAVSADDSGCDALLRYLSCTSACFAYSFWSFFKAALLSGSPAASWVGMPVSSNLE